jgi:hypothetical protein
MVDDVYCRACGQEIIEDDPWWLAEEETEMPCGHSAETDMVEGEICPECRGMGRSLQAVGRSEWLAIQAGWVARYLFVLLAILIPVFVMAAIIGREHGDWSLWKLVVWGGIAVFGLWGKAIR